MDFSSILQYLQGLLGNKQQQQTNQFGQNLGLQQQELAQQGSQFEKNLGQQGTQFNANLDLQKKIQDQANALAQGEFGLKSNNQQFEQGLANRMNVTPGSAVWMNMQQMQDPNSLYNLGNKAALDRQTAQQAPIQSYSYIPKIGLDNKESRIY